MEEIGCRESGASIGEIVLSTATDPENDPSDVLSRIRRFAQCLRPTITRSAQTNARIPEDADRFTRVYTLRSGPTSNFLLTGDLTTASGYYSVLHIRRFSTRFRVIQ